MESFNRKGVDFGSVRNSVDPVSVAQGYTQLKRQGRDLSGPCPFCGGEDRFYLHGDGEHFGCRKCGFWGDVIDLVSKADGITKAEAAVKLLGSKSSCIQMQTPSKEAVKAPVDQLELIRQADWRELVQRAEESLEGSPAQRYIQDERGLDMATARRFRLGSGSFMGRAALVIPIIGQGGAIEAVKYRFVDQLAQDEKAKRFSQEKGSSPGLFGAHCLVGLPTLVIVEGEMNAVTLAQALVGEVDVLSIGSQNGNICRVVEIAKRYSKVVIWFDEGGKAAEARKHVQGATAFKSPDLGNGPLDANDILKIYGVETLRDLVLRLTAAVKEPQSGRTLTALSGNKDVRTSSEIKIDKGAPPIPPHIRPLVRVWTREIAENWAWAECVNPKSPYRSTSTTGTVSGAIASIIKQWESNGGNDYSGEQIAIESDTQ